ncbi:hypothetical protein [Nitrospira sp. BLG_2]
MYAAYTVVMNPDAERWRELAAYDLGTAEAILLTQTKEILKWLETLPK